MNIRAIVKNLENCPCGKKHTVNIKACEIGSGILEKTAELLKENEFPRKVFVVADRNTLAAADGILEILEQGGFSCHLKLYDDLRVADIKDAEEIIRECREYPAILSVGTGSLNDICRYAALHADKSFAIFATAPSMDGFSSGTAPITENNFKTTRPARQPEIILADTAILAASPAFLKAAGFGDMIAKYVALTDWRISHVLTGEYYCEKVASLTREALKRVVALADKVTAKDEETAGAIMEALVMTGLAMKLGDSVRPASGAEHIVSHFWEIKKLEQGQISDFHGKKVGVATLAIAGMYHDLIANSQMKFHPDAPDWEKIYNVYGSNFRSDVEKMNTPPVTEETSVEKLYANWETVRAIVKEELPTYEEILRWMEMAGAATTVEEIAVSYDLGVTGLQYHPYMRHRMTLARLIPMMDCTVDYKKYIR